MPEAFQSTLIKNITDALLSQREPPCLLRAPTGSGKTFMLSQCMQQVGQSPDVEVIWFWFVPYSNLVMQTLDALKSSAPGLAPVLLADGLDQEPVANQVLVSTTQGVSRSMWRREHYDAGGGEDKLTLAQFKARAKANELSIGVIVDEAHIALDNATEFGHFVKWLAPDYLAMATATPKSDRINTFLHHFERSSFESFNVSRDDVIAARLNKAYVEAVIYDLSEQIKQVADLKLTLLRQAWKRNQILKAKLKEAGVTGMTPLLLVQVANGDGTVEEAETLLTRELGVSPHAIGKHSADDPNPTMMGAIANDASIEVLIFKQSAGTGFDAPRAFVLASLKPVNDPDFAMQFIGRVMRVAKPIRDAFSTAQEIPDELNTAYIYLGNAEAQAGYQAAVKTSMAVKSQLEGQVEKMHERKTRSGARAYSNRPTQQGVLSHKLPIGSGVSTSSNDSSNDDTATQSGNGSNNSVAPPPATGPSRVSDDAPSPEQQGNLGLFGGELDEVQADNEPQRPSPHTASSWQEWVDHLSEHGISVYPLRRDFPEVPQALDSEVRPDIMDMEALTKKVATRLVITPEIRQQAIRLACGKHRESERRIELTRPDDMKEKKVSIALDRNALAREANIQMNGLPMLEDDDRKILVETIAQRLYSPVEASLLDSGTDVDEVDESKVLRLSRYAAHWVICTHRGALEEALWEEVAEHAKLEPSEPLPDAYLYPTEIGLNRSTKHLYGIMPPKKGDTSELEHLLDYESRQFARNRTWKVGDRTIRSIVMDNDFFVNNDEKAFAEALDRVDFVAWWFRNPDRKPFSVRLVRGEHRNNFYPDFVVCVHHLPGDKPLPRIVETKHDVKDIRHKSQHSPQKYGDVIFITKDKDRYYLVNKSGAIGDEVSFGSLDALHQKLQQTAPC
nr:DEAD/DEAH box helicase family protein [uncultured Halomonas sp.]